MLEVTLKDDQTVDANVCNNGKCDGAPISGSWFAFYDQAFKVDLETGLRFIANYKYAIKEYVTSDALSQGAKEIKKHGVETDDYDKFYSQCDHTMVGFVQDKKNPTSMSEHHIECFYGVKAKVDIPKNVTAHV
jgi:hypothetical protein